LVKNALQTKRRQMSLRPSHVLLMTRPLLKKEVHHTHSTKLRFDQISPGWKSMSYDVLLGFADGGNVWLYYNWHGFIVWNLSQIWIGKTLLDQTLKIVFDKQTLSLCNWDIFLVWKCLSFEIFNHCRMNLETIFQTKEGCTLPF
jgi:hypothetical protein